MHFKTNGNFSGASRAVFLIFLLFLFCAEVSSEKIPFKSYTTAEGLAHDRVNRIVRDSRGFLWFCTSEGLSRFDGYEFKNYRSDEGLPHRSVMDFLETRDGGKLWLATGDGIVLFNPAGVAKNAAQSDKPEMFRVFRDEDLKDDTKSQIVIDLLEDRNGTIWAAAENGLYQYALAENNQARLMRVFDKRDGLIADHWMNELLETADGRIFVTV